MATAPRRKSKGLISHGVAAQNRKARFDYPSSETIEAGLVLRGPEVKSLRLGRATWARLGWRAGRRAVPVQLLHSRIAGRVLMSGSSRARRASCWCIASRWRRCSAPPATA